MRAIQYDRFGDYEVLHLVDAPRPAPQSGQALVRLTLAARSLPCTWSDGRMRRGPDATGTG
ncbi:hypothetical protein [Streptomyces sp. NPDC046759]|uniref:hypothetical protein n=1 Tax=Streptomyces sp. NPDC046759 TaxID=3155019 RepID=UPI0033C728EC